MDEVSLENLPYEIYLHIIEFLPTQDVFNLMLVSKYIANISRDEGFWKKRISIHFSEKRMKAHRKHFLFGWVTSKRLLVEMIYSPRSKIFIKSAFISVFPKSYSLDDSAIKAMQNTVCEYVISTAFQPLDRFLEIAQRDIPDFRGHTHANLQEYFALNQSRSILVNLFFLLFDRYFDYKVVGTNFTNLHILAALDVIMISVDTDNPLFKLLDVQMKLAGLPGQICQEPCNHILCKQRAKKLLEDEF